MKERIEYSRVGAVEAQSIDRVIGSLLDSGNLAKSIAGILNFESDPSATVFERYAASLLLNAGAQRLALVRNAGFLKVIAPEDGQLAQIVHANRFAGPLESTILAVECAINRLVCIADALADGIAENDAPRDTPRKSISILGGGYIQPSKAGWRSSRVTIPHLDSILDMSTAFYNEIDWRSTDCVASNARAVFQRSMRPNAYRTKLGIAVNTQSDWDVRTRLAQILCALELPHRYSFRFDYDDETKAVETVFTCPPSEFLPAILDDCENGATAARELAYESYIIRLVCLFAAACFGSGRSIEKVKAIGYDASWNDALVSAEFDRDEFVRSVLIAVDSNEIAEPALRFKPADVYETLKAPKIDWFANPHRTAPTILLPELTVSSHRREPGDDMRELSMEAQQLFRCKRVCDVDTASYFGGNSEAVDHARGDSGDSPLAAILRLESLVSEIEAETVPPSDDASARPLYAANPLSRLAIALLDDEMSIADQAEAFLKGHANDARGDHPKPMYFRAPDALFHALFGLSDLYQRMGDFNGAALQADRCIALAPTTESAYFRKADILAEEGLLTQAANVLIAGLSNSATKYGSSFLYYHLGLVLWNSGMRREATLVHVYNSSLECEYACKSKRIVEGMRNRNDMPSLVNLSPFDAKQELRALHLPVAPLNMRDLLTRAVVLLTNSGTPNAAVPFAHELEHNCNFDEIVIAACRSIEFGTAL